jgi:hypothetical protein
MKTSAKPNSPKTIMVPVTTMEEMPVISDAERDELIASLKEAEAEIAAGNFTIYNPDTFVDEMMAVYRAAKAKRSA